MRFRLNGRIEVVGGFAKLRRSRAAAGKEIEPFDILNRRELHAATVFGERIVVTDFDVEGIAEVERQLGANRILLLRPVAADMLARRDSAHFLEIAVGAAVVCGDADAHPVGYRTTDISAEPLVVEARVGGLGTTFPGIARRNRIDQNRTTRGITAIKRALRTFKDLHVLDVRKIDQDGERLRLIQAVDVDRDVVLIAAVDERRDTADRRLRGRPATAQLIAAGDVRQILHRVDARIGQSIRRKQRNRHRHVFERLVAALCRNDNHVVIRSRTRRLGVGGRNRKRRCQRRGAKYRGHSRIAAAGQIRTVGLPHGNPLPKHCYRLSDQIADSKCVTNLQVG